MFAGARSVAGRTGEVKRTGRAAATTSSRAVGDPAGGVDAQHDQERQPAAQRAAVGRVVLAGGRALPGRGARAAGRRRAAGGSIGRFIPPRSPTWSIEVVAYWLAQSVDARVRHTADRAHGRRLVPSARHLVDGRAGPGANELPAAPSRSHLGAARRGPLGTALGAVRGRRLVVAGQRRSERDHRDWGRSPTSSPTACCGCSASVGIVASQRHRSAARRSRRRTPTGFGSPAPTRWSGQSGWSRTATDQVFSLRSHGRRKRTRADRVSDGSTTTGRRGCGSPRPARQPYRGPVYSLEVPYAHTVVSTDGLELCSAIAFPKMSQRSSSWPATPAITSSC